MANKSKERIRGTVDVGFSTLGKSDLVQMAKDFGRLGGFDIVYTSPLYRMRKTAQAIVAPKGVVVVTPVLHSWPMGMYEGWPSESAKPDVLKYTLETPDDPPPGVGCYTGMAGGSFNDYAKRFLLSALKPALELAKANKDKKIAIVIHSHNYKIANAGIKQNFELPLKMTKEEWEATSPPGATTRFVEGGPYGWTQDEFDPATAKSIDPGMLYAVRHPPTWWSSQSWNSDGTSVPGNPSLLPPARAGSAQGDQPRRLPPYPADHLLGMVVPQGGSNCAKCKYLNQETRQNCSESHFNMWNGGSKLPAPADRYCCDYFEARN